MRTLPTETQKETRKFDHDHPYLLNGSARVFAYTEGDLERMLHMYDQWTCDKMGSTIIRTFSDQKSDYKEGDRTRDDTDMRRNFATNETILLYDCRGEYFVPSNSHRSILWVQERVLIGEWKDHPNCWVRVSFNGISVAVMQEGKTGWDDPSAVFAAFGTHAKSERPHKSFYFGAREKVTPKVRADLRKIGKEFYAALKSHEPFYA